MKLVAHKIMEQRISLIDSLVKRLWKLLRLALVAVRKSISKHSRPVLKRVKIAAVAFHSGRHKYPFAGPQLAYEFSCSNSPAYPPVRKWPRYFLSRRDSKVAPPSQKEFERILGSMLMGGGNQLAVEASPALPGFGFGRSPVVRQLRITDSPFPVNYVGENSHIDEDAEKFIEKFYRELFNQQNLMASPLVVL
uniref:Avr9/Cf-9 rapidly elicited protein 146 n=1 Tax=Kalanchoe fedtschenkoi TaxID=63787 RepID=A0A7N0UY68_KALFE